MLTAEQMYRTMLIEMDVSHERPETLQLIKTLAEHLAATYAKALRRGYTFMWEQDPGDRTLWQCTMLNQDSQYVDDQDRVDFNGNNPVDDPYSYIIEAELALTLSIKEWRDG